jgi:hypothetical protein
MNKADRKNLEEALGHLRSASELLGPLAEGEREKYDNLTEGLQNSERGQAFNDAADALESALENVDGAIEGLEGIE